MSQAGLVDHILKWKLFQCAQFPQISQVLDALCDSTQESTRSIPDMSVFDYPTLDDNTLRVAPHITPSGAGWTRVCNIVDYGSVTGGYGDGLDRLLATADELFLGNQAPLSTWHGLYPLLTMAQHSCPNSVTSYVGESAMLRATQDLAAGDQVTISHMASLSVPVTDRQQRLQEKCACPRCTVEEKLPRRIQTKI